MTCNMNRVFKGIAILLFPFSLCKGTLNNGLVAWYPLDGNASDMTSNSNHGTNYGATPTTDRNGRSNRALLFDGSNDYVQAAYSSTISTSNFSYSLWAKPTQNTSLHGSPITFRNSGRGFNLYKQPDNTWSYWIGNGGWVTIGNQPITLSWTALAFTYDGTTLKAYQNGSQVASSTTSYLLNQSRPLRIGAGSTESNSPNYYFKGSVDEVRIYNRALSSSEIGNLYTTESTLPNSPPVDLNSTVSISFTENLNTGSIIGQFTATGIDNQSVLTYSLVNNTPTRSSDLIGWFKFDEGSGSTSENFGSQGSDATFINSATFSTSEKKYGSASLHIPSSNGNAYARLNSTISLGGNTNSNNYSISTWFKELYPATSWRTLLRGSSANHQVIVSSSNNRLGVYNHNHGGFIDSGYDLNPSASANSWQHIAASFNGSNTKIYIDGNFVGTSQSSPGNNVYAIGNYQGGGQRFAKYLDDFRVYGVTLSANEVSQIYSNGHGDLNANYNSFFTIESNGTLKTAVPFDFETNATTYQIMVRVTDELNAYTEGNFTLTLTNVVEDPDGDGIENHLDPDDDNDGFTDVQEVQAGTNPESNSSKPNFDFGMIGWWRFDETSGTTAQDSSGNSYHATLYNAGSGSASWTTGKLNGALLLDGSNDYLAINTLHYTAQSEIPAVSLSAWIKTGRSSQGYIISYDRSEFWRLSVGGESNNGKLFFATMDSQGIADQYSQVSVSNNVWRHIVVSYDSNSSTKYFYIDGSLDSSYVVHGNRPLGSKSLTRYGTIGTTNEDTSYNNGGTRGSFFQGEIDDLRLYDRKLSASEVTQIYNLPGSDYDGDSYTYAEEISAGTDPFDSTNSPALSQGLLAWYPFEGNASDMSGNNRNGTLTGNPGYANAIQGQALSLDGLDDHMDISHDSALDPRRILTYSFWFNSTSQSKTWTPVLFKGNSSGQRTYAFWLNSGEKRIHPVTVDASGQYDADSSNNFWAHNQWYSVATVMDRNSGFLKLYVNGQLITNTTIPQADTVSNSNSLRLGWGYESNNDYVRFHGLIDNLRLYNRALSNTDISRLYAHESYVPNNNTAPHSLSPTSNLSITENTPIDNIIGQFNATDPDQGSTITYHLVSGLGDSNNSLFSLETNGSLKNAVLFDYETNASTYSIRVQAKDEYNASVEGNFTVNLTNQIEDFDNDGIEDHYDLDDDNDSFSDAVEIAYGSDPRNPNSVANAAPNSLTLSSSQISENQSIGTVIGNLNATDPDSGALLSFNLVNGQGDGNNSLFSLLSNGTLKSNVIFDFETNASTYSIRTRVTDQHGAFLENTFSISLVNQVEDFDIDGVEDHYDLDDDNDSFSDAVEIAYGSDPRNPNSVANAAPNSLTLSSSQISENQSIGTVIGNLNATDPDSGALLSFNLVNGQGDGNNSLFSLLSNGTLKSNAIFDFETNASTYSIRTRVTDQHGAFLENTFSISLVNQIEDFDNDGVEDHYDLDDDNDSFSDAVEIAYGSDPRNPNSVANAAPNSLTLSSSQILENQSIGTVIGNLNATDPDSGTLLSFNLVNGQGDGNNSLFSLLSNGTLKSNVIFDFETNASTYSIRTRVTDQHGAFLENTFSISLVNQVEDFDNDGVEDHYDPDDDNDTFSDAVEIAYGSDPRNPNSVANAAPNSLVLSNASFMENMPKGFLIGQLSATDPDKNNTLKLSFAPGKDATHNQLFQIDQNNSLRTSSLFRYENEQNTYSIRIKAVDDYNASISQTFILKLIKDIDQFPQLGKTNVKTDPNGRVSFTTSLNFESNKTLPKFKYIISKTADYSSISTSISALLENNSLKASVYNLDENSSYFARVETIFEDKFLISQTASFSTPSKYSNWWESDIKENLSGWRKSNWLGSYLPHKSGWIYHQTMGWLYAHQGQDDDFWFWSQEYQWIWTKNGIYPFLYRNNSANWLYILGIKNGKAVIHDYSDGAIE